MNEEPTFDDVLEALQIANKIQRLRKWLSKAVNNMTYKDDAGHRLVSVNDAEDYFLMVRLNCILDRICNSQTNKSDDSYTGLWLKLKDFL